MPRAPCGANQGCKRPAGTSGYHTRARGGLVPCSPKQTSCRTRETPPRLGTGPLFALRIEETRARGGVENAGGDAGPTA